MFIVATLAPLLSFPFTGFITETDYLGNISAHETAILVGATLEFIMCIAIAGIAIWIYPILRRFNPGAALGYVGLRLFEGVMLMVAIIPMLALLGLGQEFIAAGSPDFSHFQTSGALLLGMRDWAGHGLATLAFCLGALVFYFLLYRSRLVPRWLSGWGFIGALLSLISALYAIFTQSLGFSSVNVLDAPLGINEMVLAVWLIAKGFDKSAIESLAAR